MLSESENLRASQTFSGIFRANMRIGRPEFWTAFFTGALAGATFYALFYARAQIKEAHQEAQVQHLLALEQQYENEPMATYRKRLAEGRLKGEEEPDDLYRVLDFFETVGRLVDREYLDQSDVWDNFAYPVSMRMPEKSFRTTSGTTRLSTWVLVPWPKNLSESKHNTMVL